MTVTVKDDFEGAQDFNRGCHCRCDGNSKRTSRSLKMGLNCSNLMINLSSCEAALMDEKRKQLLK